jgi:hypothetical protein
MNIFKRKNAVYYSELNMEKHSVTVSLLCIIVITSVLVIPMLPGITAAENDNNSISKELQWCCSYIEEEDNDSQDLLILNNLPKHNSAI